MWKDAHGVSRLPHLSPLPVVAALAFIIGGYFAFTTGSYVIHNYQARQDERALRADIDRLDREHDELIAVRDYLSSDEYVEYEARRTVGLVHPGQTLVIVSGATAIASPTPEITATPGGAWWHGLFRTPVPLPSPAPTP